MESSSDEDGCSSNTAVRAPGLPASSTPSLHPHESRAVGKNSVVVVAVALAAAQAGAGAAARFVQQIDDRDVAHLQPVLVLLDGRDDGVVL